MVILKESYACFIFIRTIKIFGWIKKAAEYCLNDLIFFVFIRLLILHHMCVQIINAVVLKTFTGPIALEKVFLLFSKGSCPIVYDCS